MPSKRTWLFIVVAALLIWQRPWRRLARRLQPVAPGTSEAPHPEAAFAGAGSPPPFTPDEAERLGSMADRDAPVAGGQTLAAGIAASADAPEFASPAFFGPGDAVEGEAEPDLIDEILALDDELDAADVLGALDADEAETLSAAPIAEQAETPASAEAEDSAENEAATGVPAGSVAMSADQPNTLMADAATGEPEAAAESQAELHEAEVGAEEPRRPDDLLVIEGIGPRTSTIVTAAGITSFTQLAEADVETLRAALTNAGIKTIDPATWPEQARLAADGRWDELKELQGRIKNGRKISNG